MYDVVVRTLFKRFPKHLWKGSPKLRKMTVDVIGPQSHKAMNYYNRQSGPKPGSNPFPALKVNMDVKLIL